MNNPFQHKQPSPIWKSSFIEQDPASEPTIMDLEKWVYWVTRYWWMNKHCDRPQQVMKLQRMWMNVDSVFFFLFSRHEPRVIRKLRNRQKWREWRKKKCGRQYKNLHACSLSVTDFPISSGKQKSSLHEVAHWIPTGGSYRIRSDSMVSNIIP